MVSVMNDFFSVDEIYRAITELKLMRQSASADFYSDRRKALDVAIKVLQDRADDFMRQE